MERRPKTGRVIRVISLSLEADEKLYQAMERLGLTRSGTITHLVERFLSEK